MRTQRNFKAKLIFVQLIAIIPLFLFIFYIFDLWYDTSRSAVLDNSVNQAQLVANTVAESLNIGIKISNILAANPGTLDRINAKSDLLEGTIKSIDDNIEEINGISLLDLSGKAIVYSKNLTPEQRTINVADREYFQTVIATQKPTVSDPIQGRVRNLPTVIMASPVIINGKVVGVTTSAYDLDVMKGKLENVMPADGKYTMLIYDKNGRLVFLLHKPMPTDQESAVFNNLSFTNKIDKTKVNIVENQKLPNSDKLYMGSIVPINGFGWTVMNLVSTDDIFAPMYKVQGVTWLILLAALLFALSLISYVMRKIKMVY